MRTLSEDSKIAIQDASSRGGVAIYTELPDHESLGIREVRYRTENVTDGLIKEESRASVISNSLAVSTHRPRPWKLVKMKTSERLC